MKLNKAQVDVLHEYFDTETVVSRRVAGRQQCLNAQ